MSDEANTLPTVIPLEKFIPTQEEEHDADLAYARENLYGAIEQAKTGLEGIADVADHSQHPRAYEVQHQFLKTLAELNKDLIQISKSKKESKEPREKNIGKVQNNLFIGSTAELAKMLKKVKNEEKEENNS